MEHIGYGIFQGCSALQSIKIPYVGSSRTAAGTTNTGEFANISGFFRSFNGSSWGTAIIPDTLTTVEVTSAAHIADDAFYRWSSGEFAPLLTTLKINEGVTTIGKNAFRGQSALGSFTIPGTVTSIGAL